MIRRAFTLLSACLVFSFAGEAKADIFSYTFDYPVWDTNNDVSHFGTNPSVTILLDNGSNTSSNQVYDLLADTVSFTVTANGGTYGTNGWTAADLFTTGGGDYNFISTDGSGIPTLDLATARNSRVVYSNAGGTWQFGTSVGFTQSWLAAGPAFGGPEAFHSTGPGFRVVGTNTTIPEPSSLLLVVAAAGGIAMRRRRK